MDERIFHPLANVFPLLEGDEFAALVVDIAAYGVREPIWLYEGLILDGRNRWRAAQEAGVECPSRDYVGDDPAAFVVSLNLHRRHLSESQRGVVASKLANMRQGERTDIEPSANLQKVSQERAAELLNVSTRTVAAAAKVLEEGAPELIDAVERGQVSVSAASQVATLPKEMQSDIVATGPDEVREVAKTIRNGPHVANNSGNNEWYTPSEYLDAARSVMGGIDTDPASSAVANERVRAGRFFTVTDNGLAKKWGGRVWMNPPYAQPLISEFCAALVKKYADGEIEEACVLVNNATETSWFRMLAESSSATCFTKSRVRFIDPDGNPSGSPLQGQSVLYFGRKANEFAESFSKLGYVYVGGPIPLAA